MSDKRVALFFDDAELGGHLRTVLAEHGAKIAHEGPLSSFDEQQLRQAGVDVLVVNLDDAVDDATLDRIYGLIDAGNMPVVFNDAQASKSLDGWDRARWARHLVTKVLDYDVIDPPRPDNARQFDAPVAVPVEAEPVAAQAPSEVSTDAPALEPFDSQVADPADEVALVHDPASPDTETLAAELEALLASGDAEDPPQDDFGSGLKYSEHDPLPALHDGDFGVHEEAVHVHVPAEVASSAPLLDEDDGIVLKYGEHDALPELHDGDFGSHDAAIHAEASFELESPAPQPIKIDAPAFHADIDHLTLAALDDEDFTPPAIEKATLAQQTPTPAAPEWGFVEDSELSPPIASQDTPAKRFGVEKVSAADYLAPEAEPVDESIEPSMSLELVSIEEAIAPRQEYEPQETRLEELDAAFARLLVLGAARDSQASLAAFLAGLPGNLRLPILLIQHQNSTSADQLAQTLAKESPLPVKVAAAGMRAKMGEVVLVPRGQNVRILRDGRVELSAANDEASEQTPSIDSSFTMAANVFGRDTVAIVFSGQATDAVAGAQAIHDRGGQVWVESSINDHYADMVHGVLAERLASFSGSPQELAVRLVEDFR
ncbi:MAG TPA: chemotaxis protein CheB [Dyella sp.]|uniref:chemotaxis protein CheB n=1 Tax=Dyella sp. TaxID=1869338 RepID=UPI002B85C8F4|nr:chemotaxis protein CheB [Dyella sp.]HTV85606.1 chemotaxis protein CheB [Dyella sp.]